MDSLIIGTRGSALARWQSSHVAEALRSRHEGLTVEERILKTEGDESQHDSGAIGALGQVGVFVRRIEEALVARDVDLAVHSLKDMPTEQPDGLVLQAVLERHDPRDALVSSAGWTIETLPPGTVVGTGSFRRRCQLLHRRPDIEVIPIRGNVDTRIRKMREGEVGAIVLAVAGLERLGIDDVPFRPIDPAVCLPAVGQGAVAVEIREGDERTAAYVDALNHESTMARVEAERAFLRRLGGGCLAPATAFARIEYGRLHVETLVGDPDGQGMLCEREVGDPIDAEIIGARLAERLLAAGAELILDRMRDDGSGEHGSG